MLVELDSRFDAFFKIRCAEIKENDMQVKGLFWTNETTVSLKHGKVLNDNYDAEFLMILNEFCVISIDYPEHYDIGCVLCFDKNDKYKYYQVTINNEFICRGTCEYVRHDNKKGFIYRFIISDTFIEPTMVAKVKGWFDKGKEVDVRLELY